MANIIIQIDAELNYASFGIGLKHVKLVRDTLNYKKVRIKT